MQRQEQQQLASSSNGGTCCRGSCRHLAIALATAPMSLPNDRPWGLQKETQSYLLLRQLPPRFCCCCCCCRRLLLLLLPACLLACLRVCSCLLSKEFAVLEAASCEGATRRIMIRIIISMSSFWLLAFSGLQPKWPQVQMQPKWLRR